MPNCGLNSMSPGPALLLIICPSKPFFSHTASGKNLPETFFSSIFSFVLMLVSVNDLRMLSMLFDPW